MRDSIKINIQLNKPDSSQQSPSSRSRSRSPNNDSSSTLTDSYRDRSKERSSNRSHGTGIRQDRTNSDEHSVVVSSTSFDNIIESPEQERGRSKERVKSVRRESDPKELSKDGAVVPTKIVANDSQDGPEDEEDGNMISLMGFTGFGSTKGKQVKGTKGGAVKQEKKTEYRQYMNRTKGFNRPLSPTRGNK